MFARTIPVFRDRRDAGRRLADRLDRYLGRDVTVLALPRGGVPIAEVVADRLRAPLDVFVVRKIGAPGDPEYALGAVAEEETLVLDFERIRAAGTDRQVLDEEIRERLLEVDDRIAHYRGSRPAAHVGGRTAILVDDGLATGSTARAAVRAIRMRRPQRVVLAAGVASPESVAALSREVDELVCPCVPADLVAVGAWYREFDPVSDEEVRDTLDRHAQRSVDILAGT